MSKAFPSVWKNKDTNSEQRSEVTCDRTPCFEKTWSTNSWASMGAVMVSTVGTNMDCLVSRSTMMRMVSCLEDGGSFLMKSMEMEFQGNSGTGSYLSNPLLSVGIQTQWGMKGDVKEGLELAPMGSFSIGQRGHQLRT